MILKNRFYEEYVVVMKEIIVMILVVSIVCVFTFINDKRIKILGAICIFLNLVYRFEFIFANLALSLRMLCKLLEFILIVILFVRNKKNIAFMTLNIFMLILFIAYMIPTSVILNSEQVWSLIFSSYGTGGSEVGKGLAVVANIKNILFCIMYILFDIYAYLSNRLICKTEK